MDAGQEGLGPRLPKAVGGGVAIPDKTLKRNLPEPYRLEFSLPGVTLEEKDILGET